jgi:hypothetical protein
MPKIANNRIYSPGEHPSDYFTTGSNKKKSLSLANNKFYKRFPDQIKEVL